MTDEPFLSEIEAAFVKAYFAQVGKKNGKAAAMEAGIPERFAAQRAWRWLKEPRIIKALHRLETEAKRQAASILTTIVRPSGIDGEIITPGMQETLGDRVADLLLNALCRDWVVTRLMRNVQLGMAEIKLTQTRILKEKDGNYTAIQVEAFERDAAGANQAMGLLMKELDRREEAGQREDTSKTANLPALTTNPLLAEAFEKFKQAATAARATAAAARPMNGNGAHTNGKGHHQ